MVDFLRGIMAKRIDNLFEQIIEFDNIRRSINKACRGKNRYGIEELIIQEDIHLYTRYIQDLLINDKYEFDEYTEFIIKEPKERLIHAPSAKDKIVQLAINNILSPEFNKRFINDSYACIVGKGTHKCIEQIQNYMNRAYYKYGPKCYILKLDIKKFFYNIDRDILKRLYKNKIKDKRLLKLINIIIDSSNSISEKGLPLGNTLSQLSANVYINEFDQYVKRVLKIKYYIRYMDDMFLMLESKEKAKEILHLSEKFLNEKLNLQLNKNKSQYFTIRNGLNAIGFKIYRTHRLLRNDSKKKIKKKLRNYIKGKIDTYKINRILISWCGHAGYGNTYNFKRRLISHFSFLYFTYNAQIRAKPPMMYTNPFICICGF